jgi:hypothetical protein
MFMLKGVPETVLQSVEPEAAGVDSASYGDRWKVGATPRLEQAKAVGHRVLMESQKLPLAERRLRL